MLPVEIDFCSPADVDAVWAVEEASFWPPWPRAVIERDLAGESDYLYLCARAGGRALGFAVLQKRGPWAELANIAVLPLYRKRGVASQLLAAAGEIASEIGCRAMSLRVRVSNTGAAALYRLFGFSPAGREREYYADGEDAFIMEARLPLRLPGEGEQS